MYTFEETWVKDLSTQVFRNRNSQNQRLHYSAVSYVLQKKNSDNLGKWPISSLSERNAIIWFFMLYCHILNCNKLPSAMFSVSVKRNPVIKEETFEKDITWNRWTHIFIYLVHATFWCFSASLCLLLLLSSSSLLFWSLFSLCSHPYVPKSSPKRQTLRHQLILAVLPRMKAKRLWGPLSFYCHC